LLFNTLLYSEQEVENRSAKNNAGMNAFFLKTVENIAQR